MGLSRLRRFAAGVAQEAAERDIALVAAGVAFYAMLALFPALTALVAVWGIFADSAAVRAQLDALAPLMPSDVHRLLADQLAAIPSAGADTLGWAGIVSLLLSLWSARAGVSAVIRALNAVFGVRSRRRFGHHRAALGLTATLIGVAIVAMAAVVVAPVVLAVLPLGPLATVAAEAVRWAVVLAVMVVGAGLLYRFGPNRPRHGRPWISVGAAIAIALWLAASAGFSAYLASFGIYNKVYGSLGAVVALLMWLYLSGYLLLLGAVIDARRERADRRDAPARHAPDGGA